MVDLIVAVDDSAATRLLQKAETAIGTIGQSGVGHLGPFDVDWSVAVSFSGGTVAFKTGTGAPANVIALNNVDLNYVIDLTFEVDLNQFLPHGCLPQVCVDIPFIGTVCSPAVCVSWPTVKIPVKYPDKLTFSADFTLVASLASGEWSVAAVIDSVPNLQLSPAAAAIIIAIGAAIGLIISVIPFIGPFIGVAVAAIIAAIGIAGALGLLGPIITPFVAGRSFTLFQQQQRIQLLAANSALEPPVLISITELTAGVQLSDKAELVVSADISE